MPGRVRVERRGRGMFGPKLVRKLAVDTGDQRLELRAERASVIETRRARLSGGIVLKNEPLDTEAWLLALGEALAAEAQRSEQHGRRSSAC